MTMEKDIALVRRFEEAVREKTLHPDDMSAQADYADELHEMKRRLGITTRVQVAVNRSPGRRERRGNIPS